MPSDKDRLYVALYARGGAARMIGGEDKYHWAFIIGPKTENAESRGKRIHAKEQPDPSSTSGSTWEYEEREINMIPTAMILVRIVIAKIRDKRRVLATLKEIPMRPERPGWNCVEWLMEALEALGVDGRALGTSVTDWRTIRDSVMAYVNQKHTQHRFDGKARPGQFDTTRVSTYDLLDGVEIFA